MTDALMLSLLTGIFVGFSAGYLGSLMVLEKMSLVGDALSHVALPGLALGYLYNFPPFLGAFAFLFTSAVIIWYLERVTKTILRNDRRGDVHSCSCNRHTHDT
jgi:ABC-type Mn2+/Zn2+ transport system permease subunit